MRVCIHRGTKQIGGTCVEIEAGGKRILLDLGIPLDAEEPSDELLPQIDGLKENDPSLLGIVISHPHQDHYGLIHFAQSGTPIAMGEAASRIIQAASQFFFRSYTPSNALSLKDKQPISLGPFTITPYLVDHSAYDAYSILVEAEGKRLFYSGDFRGHGRKAALFDRFIANPPENIDVLLMEGSSIGRIEANEQFPTETELEDEFVEGFNKTVGLAMVYASSQNIDRIVTIYRACLKANRTLVIDLYTAAILESLQNRNIPQGTWDNMRIFIPHYQRIMIKEKGLFDLLNRFSDNRIFHEDLNANKSKAVLLFRPSMITDMEKAECLDDAQLFYSLWSGYLKDDRHKRFLDWLDQRKIPMQEIHTSGHASIQDLRIFSEALKPKTLIPIHSFEPGRYAELFDNVLQKDDGEWWQC